MVAKFVGSKKSRSGFAISIKNVISRSVVFSCFFSIMEIIFRTMQGLDFTFDFIWSLLFSWAYGFVLASLFTFFPRGIDILLSETVMLLAMLWAATQICYYGRFLTHMEFSKITMGKAAADEFTDDFISAITEKIPQLLALTLVFIIFSLLVYASHRSAKRKLLSALLGIAIGSSIWAGTVFSLSVLRKGQHGLYEMYKNNRRVLDNDISSFGLYTSLRLDLQNFLGRNDGETEVQFEEADLSVLLIGGTSTPTPTPIEMVPTTEIPYDGVQTGETHTEVTPTATPRPSDTPTPIPYNVLDIDFNSMMTDEKDGALLDIHKYIKNQKGSRQNEYTGMFEGYNLIMLCCESFSDRMINEELTPTLYKMSHNGLTFENFYGSFYSITTNGEFCFLTGLMPNTVGKVDDLKTNSTSLATAKNYMPFTMANMFEAQGYTSYGYHGNKASYYERGTTHPNLGYSFMRFLDFGLIDGVKYTNKKLNYTTARPNSDYETLKQTVNDYLSNVDANGNVVPFHAYYMTYSGHHPYYDIHKDTDSAKSPVTFFNREIVDNIPASEVVRSYIAANLELEKAMTFLLEELEKAGCLDNTVIVLTNDHYPYGLHDSEFKELAKVCGNPLTGESLETFQNAFICYCPGMKENVVIDTPCSTPDILPTLLNLFGFEYDSRLLSGTDILDPESVHIAMLYNQSFVTDYLAFDKSANGGKGKTYYFVDESLIPDNYLDACKSYVNNKFETSLQMINKDYYRVVLQR